MLKNLMIASFISVTSLIIVACGGEESGPTKIAECNEMYNLALKHEKLLGTSQSELDKMVEKINKSSSSEENQIRSYCMILLEDAQRLIK